MVSARWPWLLHALLEGGGRVSARRPRYLFFASPKKSTQKKGDPAARVPLAGGEGAACDARAWGVPQNSLRSSNSAQTAAASQTTMRVSFGTRSPQALRFSARSEGGGSGLHTGHCFARPQLPRCAWPGQSDRAQHVGSAQRVTDTRRSCAAAAGWYPLPTPSGCAEKRRGWGGCVCRRTHALRPLACRCCLSGVHPQGERSEFIGTTPDPSIAGCPHRPTGRWGTQTGGRLLFGDFLLATQEKVTAPPGAHPGLRPRQNNKRNHSAVLQHHHSRQH
jgi:hypothetical protein